MTAGSYLTGTDWKGSLEYPLNKEDNMQTRPTQITRYFTKNFWKSRGLPGTLNFLSEASVPSCLVSYS